MKIIDTKTLLMSAMYNAKDVHIITEEEKQILKNKQLSMYKDLEAICERFGLRIMLAYGSLLGAVRHKGFIPWDDDIDVFMPREDYNMLIQKYYSELPNTYILYAPNGVNGPTYKFAKLVDKNSLLLPACAQQLDDIYQGIYIDIFPLDYVSNCQIWNNIKHFWLSFVGYIACSVLMYETKTRAYKELMSHSIQAKCNYYLRNAIGFCFSWRNSSEWFNHLDIMMQSNRVYNTFSDIEQSYLGPVRLFTNDMIFPLIKEKFEDTTVYVPNQADKILSMLYGDWHKIPSPQKRWQHFIRKMEIFER